MSKLEKKGQISKEVKWMQILLIRHGESEDDFLEEGYKGSTDLQLTKRGLEQVEKMSSYILKEFPPEFIWSSTLLRAIQSTEILSNAAKCPVEYLIELCEMQKGESKLDFRLRAENILAAVRERSKQYKRIAIVSHGGVITKIIDSFLQLPKEHDVWFHTDNTGIHLLEYKSSVRIVRFSNNTTHLN
ncbi:histidine phosphatase family protein [Bacillus sp. Xin]|uniref:histidine phosphatase family protein n=1 Tax=unclassified Bacillus (in: firmicutes) TaxID=185979 RepID=UPI001573AD15|nr:MULTISPECIES: histidine phosphatase family protein [unclassified Bacillus (in: firmicutes)]MBC6975937.1 histidine phosphatase family protein [Bacillus sp. Xin]NSW38815.1 histidine phosphatase family protein [Bacillus sp. Xin1]